MILSYFNCMFCGTAIYEKHANSLGIELCRLQIIKTLAMSLVAFLFFLFFWLEIVFRLKGGTHVYTLVDFFFLDNPFCLF